MYKRSCSSLYRLPRFINCPTYITLHYITRTKKKKETDEVDEMWNSKLIPKTGWCTSKLERIYWIYL